MFMSAMVKTPYVKSSKAPLKGPFINMSALYIKPLMKSFDRGWCPLWGPYLRAPSVQPAPQDVLSPSKREVGAHNLCHLPVFRVSGPGSESYC